MTIKTPAELKAKFQSGDEPTAQDFVDLIDSFLLAQLGNFPNPLPAVSGKNLLDIIDTLPVPLPALDARNLFNVIQSEWITVPATPTYATATTFVVQGDLTVGATNPADRFFVVDRRLRLTIAGVFFATDVEDAIYDIGNNVTTVTTVDALPGSQLEAVAVGLFTPTQAGGALSLRALGQFAPVSVMNSAAQLIPNITLSLIQFDTTVIDPYGAHDPANNSRIVVPAGANFGRFCFYVAYATNAIAGNRAVQFFKNSSGTNELGSYSVPGFQGYNGLTPLAYESPVIPVTPGDFWEILAYQDSGSSINIGSIGVARSRFTALFYP